MICLDDTTSDARQALQILNVLYGVEEEARIMEF